MNYVAQSFSPHNTTLNLCFSQTQKLFFCGDCRPLLLHHLIMDDTAPQDTSSLKKGARVIAKEAKRQAVKKVNKVVDRASEEYSHSRTYQRFQDEDDDYYSQPDGNYTGDHANDEEGSSDATEGHDDEDEIYEGEYQGIPSDAKARNGQVALGQPLADGLKDRRELENERQADEEELAQQYELIIQECGHGRFQWQLFFTLGFALMSDGVEVFVVGFVLPSAETDMCVPDSSSGWLGKNNRNDLNVKSNYCT